jgi:PAS domain S-box-containing protein
LSQTLVEKSTNKTSLPSVRDGKRILYRLLLVAVAVVYALVFVLDYILQLHFTFFLLSSLFVFVIITLLYMWFRVSKTKEPEEHDEDEGLDDKKITPDLSLEDLPDALFHVNPRTGLTIDVNAAALRLLGAEKEAELVGIDLTTLFVEPWTAEQNANFRSQLNAGITATGTAKIRTLSGTIFNAVIQADKFTKEGRSLLLLRIHDERLFRELTTDGTVQSASDAFRATFEKGDIPMLMIGADYKVKSANRSFCMMMAYRENELDGLNMLELLHPGDKEEERARLSRHFRGEAAMVRREVRFIRRTNEVVWLQISTSLTRNEKGAPSFILAMAENVTQRKRMEQSVRESRNRLNDLIENKEYGIISIDRHHTILLLNSRIADFFYGLTGVVVEKGFNFLDIVPHSLRSDYLAIFEKAFAGESQVLERMIELSTGKNYMELIVTPVMGPNGQVASVSFFAHDVTARKNAETDLLSAREKAEASTEAKSSFLATMSHEIRTPLNGVIGMGKLLNQTNLTTKQQEYVDSILLSGEALLSVINDILDISKIESSRMELEHKPFALKRCIEETFDLLASKAIEKKLTLQYTIAKGTPAYVNGDITRLRQILMNLVSNAIKFTQRGGIVIHLSMVQELDKQQQLLFEVKDTGIGIPADRMDRLFRSYSQVDSSTARHYGGTGLGLAICKNLVELMGGTIWAKSKVGDGSTFSFTIRTSAVESTDGVKDIRTGARRLANANVLVIGEDRTAAEIYGNYFTRWNMVPQICLQPETADNLLRGDQRFNLVLIDSQLLSMNPLLVAEAIRSYKTKDQLPIVLFNAEQGTELLVSYSSDVISAIIPKNVDRSKVLDILIGLFSMEEHQRTRHDEGLKAMGSKLAQTIPARILIAEDNQINQKLAQNIFEGLGYKPVIVSNGREAIERIRNEVFDVIFMDVQMPELDGLEATRFILNKMVLPQRPYIVAMTAFALEGDKEKCIEAGMDDYISKPFMIEEIIDQLKKWSDPEIRKTPTAIVQSTSSGRPIIDMKIVNALREMTIGSDPDFFFKVIRMFLDQAEQVQAALEESLRYGNLQELAAQAHKLKGSALNIGATRLAEVCKSLEVLARTGETAGLVDLLAKLKLEAKEASKILSELK